MARAFNQLSARRAATLVDAGLYPDGGGLYLQITASGGKSWIFRFMQRGRRHDMGLGPVRTFGLAEAREAATAARKQVFNSIDPIDARRASRAATAAIPSFTAAAADYIDANKAGWKNAKHGEQWVNTLRTYADPIIGHKPVDRIDTNDVLAVLLPIWQTKTETAGRVRQRIEAVLSAQGATLHWDKPNPARWRGHLDKLLPKATKVRAVKHHPALPYADMPSFMAKLRGQTGNAARALEYLILNANRSTEARGATREEIAGSLWTIPAERMKGGVAHEVPLSNAARALLATCPTKGLLFPYEITRKRLSENAMRAVLQRMDYSHITAHGFRSSFRDWAAETTDFPSEVVEMALAHAIRDKTEAAYRRGALLRKRADLMEAWARFALSQVDAKAG